MLFTDAEMSGEAAQAAQAMPSPPSPCQVTASSDSVVSLLKDVMGILDRFSDSQVRLIAMQTAALVQGGIDDTKTYCIPALSGYEFRGNVLAGLAYVSIARSFPNMTGSIDLQWSEEYLKAKSTYLNS